MKHSTVKHRINENEVQRWTKLYRRYGKVGLKYETKRKIIMKNAKLERDILKAVVQLKYPQTKNKIDCFYLG